MKKYILIILFIFNSTLLFSDIPVQYFNYSFSKNINNGNINHAIGTDFFIDHEKSISNLGFKYVFGDNIVNIQYSFLPMFTRIFSDNKTLYDIFIYLPYLGIGANISYNINNHIFGVSPEIKIIHQILSPIMFSLAYRYNINFNYNNSHEIEFTIKLMSPWTFWDFLCSL